MARNKVLQATLVGIVALSLAPALRADTKLIISHSTHHGRIGAWIGGRVPAPMCRPPVHRHVTVAHPWHHRFTRLGPPHKRTVTVCPPVVRVVHPPVVARPPLVRVVHPPIERRVVIEPAPTVTVKAPPVVESSTISVWITNSNGSRTSVRLTRQGPWYIGPRGEYYTEMPTNEQLRVAYGF